LTLGQRRLHLGNKRKIEFFFVFRSICTTFDPWSKLLSLEKTQKIFGFLLAYS